MICDTCAVVAVSAIRSLVCIFVFRIIFFHDDTLSFFFPKDKLDLFTGYCLLYLLLQKIVST